MLENQLSMFKFDQDIDEFMSGLLGNIFIKAMQQLVM